MRFSVIVPCHNSADHVGSALKSIAEQTVPAYEIIVVDDASDDDTTSTVRRSGVATHMIRVEHRNAAASRNAGIARATGDYVAFLDADNQWLPDHLARAAYLLKVNNDGLYVSPPLQDVSPGMPRQGVPRSDFPVAGDRTGLGKEEFVDWRLRRSWGFPTTGTVVRRDVLERISGFDETQIHRHDFELVMRAICQTTWCTSPTSTWWSRPPRQGNLSFNKARCAYYSFRALKLNEAKYKSSTYSRLMRGSALNAVKTAIMEKDQRVLTKARKSAYRYLGFSDRIKVILFDFLYGRI